MKFSTHEDIEAPIKHVFAAVSDFDGFERQALRRGADVTRQDPKGGPGIGTEWKIHFKYRGKMRDATAWIGAFDPPNGFSGTSKASGVDGTFSVDLVALSPRRTRMAVSFELTPRSLTARLLIQSLRFARSKLTARFNLRVKGYAEAIEEGYYNEA